MRKRSRGRAERAVGGYRHVIHDLPSVSVPAINPGT